MSIETPQPKIIVEYDGNFADNMRWNEARFKKLVNLADLRTEILIRRGNEYPYASYTQMGEVAAWKRFLDFGGNNQEDESRQSRILNQAGQSVIYINDQVLTEKIRQKNNGQVDKKLFVEQTNNLVAGGLREIVNKEKQYQLDLAIYLTRKAFWPDAFETTLSLVEFGMIGAGAFSIAAGITIDIAALLGRTPPENALHSLWLGACGIVVIQTGFSGIEKGALRRSKSFVQRILEKYPYDPYLDSQADVTLKHFSNLVAANAYLTFKGSNLVSYQAEPNP